MNNKRTIDLWADLWGGFLCCLQPAACLYDCVCVCLLISGINMQANQTQDLSFIYRDEM